MFTFLVYSRDQNKLEKFKDNISESMRFYKSQKRYIKCESIKDLQNGRYLMKGIVNPRSDSNMILELDLDKYNEHESGLDIRFSLI